MNSCSQVTRRTLLRTSADLPKSPANAVFEKALNCPQNMCFWQHYAHRTSESSDIPQHRCEVGRFGARPPIVCSYNWVGREEFNLPSSGSVDDFTEQVRLGGSLTSVWRQAFFPVGRYDCRPSDLHRRFPNGGFSCSKIISLSLPPSTAPPG